MFFVKIDENRCTIVQNRPCRPPARPPVVRPSACRPPGRPPVRPPPVRPSARSGAGRTYIHKTPDRPPWAAVTRMSSYRAICTHFRSNSMNFIKFIFKNYIHMYIYIYIIYNIIYTRSSGPRFARPSLRLKYPQS